MPVFFFHLIQLLFFFCCFLNSFQCDTHEVRFEVPKAKMWHERVFYFFFYVFGVQMLLLWRVFFFQDVYFLHNQRLIFQRAGVSLSVTSWKLIYTVGKSSACAMIENTWMSGQIGERVCFVFSELLDSNYRFRGLLHMFVCERERERESAEHPSAP